MTRHDEELRRRLTAAYDAAADRRQHQIDAPWKVDAHGRFAARMRAAGARSVLDVGAGPGHFARSFVRSGFETVAVDLSPQMALWCRRNGVVACVGDMVRLPFRAGTFDAAFAISSVLHLPRRELPAGLAEIARILRPGGLLFVSSYGGVDDEGVYEGDDHDPPRFFARWSDEALTAAINVGFDIESFETPALANLPPDVHVQTVTAVRR